MNVSGGGGQTIEIQGAHYINNGGAVFQMDFVAAAGQSYTVQYRDSLEAGQWLKLMDVPADTARTVIVTDPNAGGVSYRYYRIVSP